MTNAMAAAQEKPAAAGFSLSEADISRIIEMAWEDRTPFEAIEAQFGLNESAVVRLMRAEMKAISFKMWRKRMNSRTTKHAALRDASVTRHRASHTRQA
jgi:uncharacterized protein (TIGR03643 family)